MKQTRVLVSALGLMLAAGFAAADPPGTPPADVTLFGQKYASRSSRSPASLRTA